MMLVSAFGTTSPYGYWGFSAVRQVMQVLYGDHQHIHSIVADHLRANWDPREGRSVVFTSDCPDCEISNLFAEFSAPIFVFLDNVEDAVAFAMASHRMNARQAIGFAVQRYCALSAIVQTPGAICFTSCQFEDDVRDLVQILFNAISGPPSQEQIDHAMSRLVPNYKPGFFTTVGEQIRQIAEEVKSQGLEFTTATEKASRLIAEVASAYRPILERKPLVALEWPRDLFTNCAHNASEGNGAWPYETIDLFGPARLLTSGPFLFLPAGTWVVTVTFEISECFSDNRMGADVCINHTGAVAVVGFDLPVRGVFTVDMTFVHKDPNCWIEVRTWLLKGAIEGKLVLHSLSLRCTDLAIKALRVVES
jgi:hypothetical protein